MTESKGKELEKSLKVIVRSSFIVLIGVLISKLLTYAYRIIIARHYGPEIYGVFSLALITLGWFSTIACLGLFDGLVRFIPFYRGQNEMKKVRYIFRVILIICTISSITSGVLLFITSNFIAVNIFKSAELIVFLKWFSILVPINVLGLFFLTTLRAFEKIQEFSFVFNILTTLSRVLILAPLIYIGLKSNSIIASYSFSILIMLLAAYWLCRTKITGLFKKGILKKEDKNIVYYELFAYSLPMLFSGVMYSLFYWIDSFSIGYLKSPLEVGIYNAAVPIAFFLVMIPELFNQILFPLITREYSKKNMAIVKELSKQVSKWILMVNLPVFILLFLFPGAAINVLFGVQYLMAENSLRILALGTLISSLFYVSTQLISVAGKSKLVLLNIIIASVINLALNFILIPSGKIFGLDNSLGIVGAAIATMVSIIILNALFFIESLYYTKIFPMRKKMFTIVLISLVPTALLLYLKTKISINLFSIVALSLLFFAVYFLLMLISKSFDINDIIIIKSVINKIKKTLPHNEPDNY